MKAVSIQMVALLCVAGCDAGGGPAGGPYVAPPDGAADTAGGKDATGTPDVTGTPDAQGPGPGGSGPDDLTHPPGSTNGFTECGTIDGKTNWCQPGMTCDATQVEPCEEECQSNSACPTGTECVKPDKPTALHKVCLPTSESFPKTASGDKAGISYCGYKSDGSVFTCSPGTYCNDPVAHRCSEGCLSYVNCGDGEYCDFFHEDAVFWKGVCAQGKGGGGGGGGGGNGCETGDQFCCCINGEYYTCPDDAAFEQCAGGDIFECLDQCGFDDFMCRQDCHENQGTPDPSACTRNPTHDGSCS